MSVNTEDRDSTIKQLGLIDIHRTLQLITAKHTLFSFVHGDICQENYMPSNKSQQVYKDPSHGKHVL